MILFSDAFELYLEDTFLEPRIVAFILHRY